MVCLPDIPRRFWGVKVVSVVPCIVVHWVLKLFGFPWDDTGEFRVNLSSRDKVFAYKMIDRLDKSVAIGKDIAVACNSLGFDLARGAANFWSLAAPTALEIMSSVSCTCSSLRTTSLWTVLLVHQSSNCCKDMPRNLLSTSVSSGRVIQSWSVILALFNIPFPGYLEPR